MKSLNQALSAWQPGASKSADPVSILGAEWREIVGEDVAANSRPAEISRDALLIVTRSGAWSQQLAFLSERILHAVRGRTGITLERVRFRVGRITASASGAARARRPARGRIRSERAPAPTMHAALERFHADVTVAQRAKQRAGWKECERCGVSIPPAAVLLCTPCRNAKSQERDAHVARLLFEAPWLGYAGIAELVGNLSADEYEAMRLRLLKRWRDVLERVRQSGGAHLTTRDRMIASSYVLLKSRLDPERIAPAVVRDLLGDELHGILYGNENT